MTNIHRAPAARSLPPEVNPMKWLKTVALLCLIGAVSEGSLVPCVFSQAENLAVLDGWIDWSDAADHLQRRLNGTAFELLGKRIDLVAGVRTKGDWQRRISESRASLKEAIGPFPERTPLNPRILGSVRKDGYTIEKVVFESLPGLYVTSCLFIPVHGGARLPAILYLSGHTEESFRNPRYQQVILNLVGKGFIVLAMDPLGQGERLQYYDPGLRRSLVGGATAEHSYFGRQCFLTGASAARYFIWDCIRAIDYLVSRPEVDPERIGATGLSGGGTQSAYVAAMDDRVAAAAPSCYITSLRRLFESIGPQDAEQNFNGGLVHRIDHADLLEARAPRATLIVSTTRDFFSIQGARETFREVKSAYESLGAGEKVGMVEDDFEHGYTRKTREAIYDFFERSLNNPGSPAELEVNLLPLEDITVTPTGQVSDSLGGQTVFSINRAEAEKLIARLEESRSRPGDHLARVKEASLRLSGFSAPQDADEIVFRGRYARSGYHVEMYALQNQGRNVLPLLLMTPDGTPRRMAVLCLHPEGKSAAAVPGGEVEQIVKEGYAVLAPDLSGTGELGRANDSIAFLGVQTGRTIVGIRAEEIVRCVKFLKRNQEPASDRICGLAFGEMSIPLLHAAALDGSIGRIALMEPPVSFQCVVTSRFYALDPGSLIANVMTAYDLPDLAACLAPRDLLVVNPVDALRKPAPEALVTGSSAIVRRSYSAQGAVEKLLIRTGVPGSLVTGVFIPWIH
jgi:dienelactone hydrolase